MEGRLVLFELQRRERHGWTVVAVIGELDLSVVPRVRAALREIAASAAGSRPGSVAARVIIDLRDVDFLDSAGLGVVLGAVRRIRGAGGIAVLAVAPASSPALLLEALGLPTVVPVAASLDDAVAGRTLGSATIEAAALAAGAEAAREIDGEASADDASAAAPLAPVGRGAGPVGAVLLGDGAAGDG
jgi:anti-sigma B factor antagonist